MQEFIDGNHVPKGFTGKYRSKICGCVVERLNGEYHCSTGPAIVYDTGFKVFWYKGTKIKEDDYWLLVYNNETLVSITGQVPDNFTGTFTHGGITNKYYKGKLHATAGQPAVEQRGQKKYFVSGIEVTEEQSKLFPLNTFIDQIQLQAFNFTSTPFKDGWFVYNNFLCHSKDGKLHNDNGPAIINKGCELYYLNGNPLTEENFKKAKVTPMSSNSFFKTLSEIPSDFTGIAEIGGIIHYYLSGELHRLGGEPAIINPIDPTKNEYWIQGIKVSKEFAPQIKELVTQEREHFSMGTKISKVSDGWFILRDTFAGADASAIKSARKLCFFHTKNGVIHNDSGFAAGGAYWGDRYYIEGYSASKEAVEALAKKKMETFSSIEKVPGNFTGICTINNTNHHFLEGRLHRIGGLPAIEGMLDCYIWGVKVAKEVSEVIKETDKPVKTILISNAVYGNPDGWTIITNHANKPVGLIHSKNGKLHHESAYAWTGKDYYSDEFYIANQCYSKDKERFLEALSKFKASEAKTKAPEEQMLKVTNALSIPKNYTGKVQYPSGLTVSYLNGAKHCADGFAAKGNGKTEEYWLFGNKVAHPEVIKLIKNKQLKTEVKSGEVKNGWYCISQSDAFLYKNDKIHNETGLARHTVYNKSSYYYLNGQIYFNKSDYDKDLNKTVAKKKRVPVVNKYKLKAEKENVPFFDARKNVPDETNGWVYHGSVKKHFVKGVLHNEDGPATIDYSTISEYKGYFLEGCSYTLDNFNRNLAMKKQALAEGALYFTNSASAKIPKDYTGTVYIGKDWKKHYVNGFLHNESGHATIHLERSSWSTYNFKGTEVSDLKEIETIKRLIKEADIVVYSKTNEDDDESEEEEEDYDEEEDEDLDNFEKELKSNAKFTGSILSIPNREIRYYVNGKLHSQTGMAVVYTNNPELGVHYLDGRSYTQKTWKKKVDALPVKLTTLASSIIPKSIKGDIKEASNRVATRQFLNLIKTLIVSKLSGGNKTTEANLKVFFNTKKGFIMLNGLMATLLPALKPMIPENFQPHLEILSKEYRIETMAMGGELIFDSAVETMVDSFRANSEQVFEQLSSELSGQVRVDLSDNSNPEPETVEVIAQTEAPAYSVN